jgi:hypothetical protein
MLIDKASLASKILDFLVVLHRCLSETPYSEDRSIYASDIATAVSWLLKLHQGQAANDVANGIVDSSTTKHFTDYWRHGNWGDLEARALNDLQRWITSVIGG